MIHNPPNSEPVSDKMPPLMTEQALLDIVDALIRDAAYNRPAAVSIGQSVGAAVEAEMRVHWEAYAAAKVAEERERLALLFDGVSSPCKDARAWAQSIIRKGV